MQPQPRTALRTVFESTDRLGIATLQASMCAAITGEEEILTYGSYRPSRMSTQGKILCFFVDDYRFQSLWSYYERTATALLEQKLSAVCEPDFSLWIDRPLAEQIQSVYQTRWLGRYFQQRGLPVIPVINWSDRRSYEFAWAGIPRGIPTAAVETRSCGDNHELFNEGLSAALRAVQPGSLLIYGEPNDWIDLPPGIRVHWKEPVTNTTFRTLKSRSIAQKRKVQQE